MIHLRNGVFIDDPLGVVLAFVERWNVEAPDASGPERFGEPDLRLANQGGARISSAEIAMILERRRAIERGLRGLAPDASLARAQDAVPWEPLRQLFVTFADIRGVGFAKTTKALHPKRPALIPMLDSVVQAYLHDDDPGGDTTFAERALALVRAYKRDLDGNRAELGALRHELARHGHALTEVRILDVLIWSVEAG